ncbi:MAG: aspartate 1-decarboxylase [bacterium]
MIRTVLKSKISYARVTDSNLFYDGSFGIDADIMKQANIEENEQIHIVNLNNGERLVTYAIAAPAGSGHFILNGPAARKGEVGDEVFIISYAQIHDNETLEPVVINVGKNDKKSS